MINNRAAQDSRHARTGKDGAFYSDDGELLASVSTFTSNVNFSNAKYQVLGDMQEHESASTYSVGLAMEQVVIESDKFIIELMECMESRDAPHWNFQGSLKGRNGSEERMMYRDVMPSGQVDLQNVNVGDVIKRKWNFFVNRPPKLQKLLSID